VRPSSRRDNPLAAYFLPTKRIAALEQLSREMGYIRAIVSGGHDAEDRRRKEETL
jgi:hypothetical protein